MKTIILFYSHSGNTKALAYKKATELGADIEEIIEAKKPFMLVGIYRAAQRKKTEIRPIKAHLCSYDKIIIMSPVWSAHPVSAFNSVVEGLPAGKNVEIVMVSGGGGTKKSVGGTKALIIQQGCHVVNYADQYTKRRAATHG